VEKIEASGLLNGGCGLNPVPCYQSYPCYQSVYQSYPCTMQSFDEIIMAEAKRRVNAEKRRRQKENRRARALAKANAEALAKANAEALAKAEEARKAEQEREREREKEKAIKITGLNARIKRREYDIEHYAWTYNTVMAYKNSLAVEQQHTMDGLLHAIHKAHEDSCMFLRLNRRELGLYMQA
jgi:hypothetical protein